MYRNGDRKPHLKITLEQSVGDCFHWLWVDFRTWNWARSRCKESSHEDRASKAGWRRPRIPHCSLPQLKRVLTKYVVTKSKQGKNRRSTVSNCFKSLVNVTWWLLAIVFPDWNCWSIVSIYPDCSWPYKLFDDARHLDQLTARSLSVSHAMVSESNVI